MLGQYLALLVQQLVELVKITGWKVVFFRAGAALGHDDLGMYRKVKKAMFANMTEEKAHIFEELDIWRITSLIANSNLVIATSLHVRIISFAYSVPRITLNAQFKQGAMISEWDYGAKECKVGKSETRNIVETATKALNCSAMTDEKWSLLAVSKYISVFDEMVESMGICNV